AGSHHPGKPAAGALAPGAPRGNPDARRRLVGRLSPLAQGKGHRLRHDGSGGMTGPAGGPDIAIVNATILPMGGVAKIERGSVTIRGNAIEAVGAAGEVETVGARKTIDAGDKVVMPGFVNCHTHIASNMLLRGLLEDVQLFE